MGNRIEAAENIEISAVLSSSQFDASQFEITCPILWSYRIPFRLVAAVFCEVRII
jgi:hypothetical protein